MMARMCPAEEIAAVLDICRGIGLGQVTPALLKAAHHTTLLLTPLPIVARVQSGEAIDVARQRAFRELAVMRHLASQDAPVIRPLAGEVAGPHVASSAVATLWPYVEHRGHAGDEDAALAATSLASVHNGLQSYAGDLPSYTETLDRCWTMLTHGSAAAMLSIHDRELLAMQYRRLRDAVEARTCERVPLHGDVHLGNLLLGRAEPVWTDFEDACCGPRELDIAGLPRAAWSLFPDTDRALIRLCADLKSVRRHLVLGGCRSQHRSAQGGRIPSGTGSADGVTSRSPCNDFARCGSVTERLWGMAGLLHQPAAGFPSPRRRREETGACLRGWGKRSRPMRVRAGRSNLAFPLYPVAGQRWAAPRTPELSPHLAGAIFAVQPSLKV